MLAVFVAVAIVACRSRPMNVGVTFDTSWTFGSATLDHSDQAIVKAATFTSLRQAFTGFDLRFAETDQAERLIRVEDTPYGSKLAFGAVGMTYPASLGSSVRIDVLFFAELSAAKCTDVDRCTKTRAELWDGLGRGVGATAAHELGHQAGYFRFARDSPCDDCYDGRWSGTATHFFGTKHWSPEAFAIMNSVLPRIQQ